MIGGPGRAVMSMAAGIPMIGQDMTMMMNKCTMMLITGQKIGMKHVKTGKIMDLTMTDLDFIRLPIENKLIVIGVH